MAELDFTQDKIDSVMVDPITGGRGYISDLIQERKRQIRDDMTIGEMYSDWHHRGARYGDADRKRFDDPPELYGQPVWTWEGRRREADPRYQELFEMRDEYQREVDKANSWFGGDGIIDLLRGAGDTIFGEDIMSQLPQISRAIENANMLGRGNTVNLDFEEADLVGMDEPYDSSSFSMRLSNAPGLEEQVESGLSYAGVSPEVAGLGALAAGMTKGRGTGSLIDMFEGLGDIPKKSQELIRDLNQQVNQKTMNEFFDTNEGKTLVRDKRREQQRMIDEYGKSEDPDKLAKGGRPGTRRRKKIMVPSSYKAGGQVFQKGYYGKTYK